MADRVYPSGKPNGAATHPNNAATAVPIPNPPPSKSHLYNPTRHPYRPAPTSAQRRKQDIRRRRFSCRRCFCVACFWFVLALIALLLLASIAVAAAYALYHPHRPLFSVTSLKISAFNLTTTPADESTHLTTRINVTLSARNPNGRIAYLYDPMSITVRWGPIDLSNGAFTNFTSSPGNISVIHAATATGYRLMDAGDVNSLKSDLKWKRGFPVEIVMDTMVGVKMEKVKIRKVGIRIRCGGIHGMVPKGKHVILSKTGSAKCKVYLRFKILKWTF